MNQAPELEQLDKLLSDGQLPKDAAQMGARLLKRINTPVRVAIFGLPQSGKSSLLNFLAGEQLVPENIPIPTLELLWGENESMSLTLQDGTTQNSNTIALAKAAGQNPAFVTIKMPAPILKSISMLEVVSDGSANDLTASLDWATRRTDLALWCTQEFSIIEQNLWSRVPDAIKDHSFLVLTKADIMSSDGVLSDKVSELQSIAANEFRSIFPIATLQASAAALPDGSADEVTSNASGGKALHKALLRQVEDGRQADLGSVLIFLNRYAPKGKKSPKPAASTPTAIPASPEPLPAPLMPEVESVGDPTVNLEKRWPDALQYLIDRGSDLSRAVADNETNDAAVVLHHCAATADQLAETFEDETTIEPEFADLQENILETAGMILLLNLENEEGPAADAVTLLLQLRKGMEEKLAA
ncbi:MAG: 50S ribosome-binding GTPase [Marinosulfonomonas sp.]|nr:50S ribosome-binding GTPase [Marinosulfonomonas sp.]